MQPSPIFLGGDLHISNKLLARVPEALESKGRSDNLIKEKNAHQVNTLWFFKVIHFEKVSTNLGVRVPSILQDQRASDNLFLTLQEELLPTEQLEVIVDFEHQQTLIWDEMELKNSLVNDSKAGIEDAYYNLTM